MSDLIFFASHRRVCRNGHIIGALMTVCAVYVGDLNDPSFDWDRVDDAVSIPSGLSPDFPPWRGPYLSCFHEWVERSGIECKQTWHEVWVAKVTKGQIHDYIEYCYGSDPSYIDPDKWLTWEGASVPRGSPRCSQRVRLRT